MGTIKKDIEILLEVQGRYGDLPRADACRTVAYERGLTVSGVSGMATRAYKTFEGRAALIKYLSSAAPKTTPAERDIERIVQAGQTAWTTHKQSLTRDYYTAVFITDMHFPMVDTTALQLTYEIIQDTPYVAYVSALSDLLDFAKFSRWEDRRNLSQQAVDDDISHVIESIAPIHHSTLKQVAPHAMMIALTGNHDLRPARDGQSPGLRYSVLSHLMQALNNQGVTFLAPMDRNNVVELSPALAWTHGWFASANRQTVANKTVLQVGRELSNRTAYDVVYGHTHHLGKYRVGQSEAFNAGCLCDLSPSYANYKMDWQHGMVIHEFDPNGMRVMGHIVNFVEDGKYLRARHPLTGRVFQVRRG